MKRIEMIVANDGPLRLYGSLEAAEADLDAGVVRAGAGPTAFDRAARPHRIQIVDNGWGIESVRIVPIPGAALRTAELCRHLATMLTENGKTVSAYATLDDLLRRAEAFCKR